MSDGAVVPKVSVGRRLAVVAAAFAPALGLAVVWGQLAVAARTTLLAHGLYWTMPVVLGLWFVALGRRLRGEAGSGGAWLRRNAAGLATAAVLTVAAVVVVPPAMRMQFDETSLCGTSQSMHRDRLAMMATGALPTPSGPVVTDWNLDKRPPLFPFLVSVVHDVAGYRVANAFVVNGVLLFALLALVACRTRRHLGVAAAVAAPVLVAAVPLLVVGACSAGFELLATWLLAVVVLAAIDFVAAPTAARASWCLASGLLFAQARYESLFVLVALAGLGLLRARRWPRDRLGTVLLLAAPILLTPVLLLLLHARDPAFYVEAAGRPLVSFAHLAAHLPALAFAFVAPGRGSPFPGALAVVSALLFGLWVWRRRGGFANVLALAPVAVVTGIALAWFYGGVAEPTAVRLYLPLAVLGALGPLLLPALVGRAWAGPALLLAAVAFAGWRWSALAAREVLPRPSAAVSLDAVDAALAGLQPDPRRTLLVSTVAQYLIVRGFAAVPPVAFAARAQGLPLPEVIVLETPLDAQLAPQVGDPQALLRGARATLLGRIEGDLPVAAWRLIP